MTPRLADVLRAWELSDGQHEPGPPASRAQLARAEQMLARRLPDDLHALYLAVGGGSFVGGNLSLHPAIAYEDDLSLATASSQLRSWEWPVPDQMVVFGDNGVEEHFGLWLPEDGGARPLVVELGATFEEACLAIVGDDLASFLAGWSAYYLLQPGTDVAAALDALRLPEDLRSLPDNGSDDELFARLSWASPNLPDPRPDPYERGMTAAQVDAVARQ